MGRLGMDLESRLAQTTVENRQWWTWRTQKCWRGSDRRITIMYCHSWWVLDTWIPGYLVPDTWFLVPGTWYLIPDTWYLIPDTWYLTSDTWYLMLDRVVDKSRQTFDICLHSNKLWSMYIYCSNLIFCNFHLYVIRSKQPTRKYAMLYMWYTKLLNKPLWIAFSFFATTDGGFWGAIGTRSGGLITMRVHNLVLRYCVLPT